jgi:hypothetical protein
MQQSEWKQQRTRQSQRNQCLTQEASRSSQHRRLQRPATTTATVDNRTLPFLHCSYAAVRAISYRQCTGPATLEKTAWSPHSAHKQPFQGQHKHLCDGFYNESDRRHIFMGWSETTSTITVAIWWPAAPALDDRW